MNERFQQMLEWLKDLDIVKNKNVTHPVPASSDASFRRYYRVVLSDGGSQASYIIMDAPVEHEDCRPFIKVSREMQAMGLHVPEVIAEDVSQGFLLLTDLGTTTYLTVLRKNEQSRVDKLYNDALRSLVQLQSRGQKAAQDLPAYDEALLRTEMSLFKVWLLEKQLDYSLTSEEEKQWEDVQNRLVQSALNQPKVYVHRDYHSRNLMISDGERPGILDFQDAVYGPLTYDAVSLIRDCYIEWPEEQVIEWQRSYFLQLCKVGLASHDEWQGFVKAMDLMGIQRHLKAAGIFARLLHRDGKDGYIDDIPLTLNYILQNAKKYPETAFLAKFLDDKILPTYY